MKAVLPPGQIIPTAEQFAAQKRVREIGRKNVLADAHGEQYLTQQKAKSKLSRKPKNENGKTIEDLISEIAKNNPEEKPSALWPHLGSAIEQWAGSCTEKTRGPKDPLYEYSLDDEKIKTITYSTFRKKLKEPQNGI